MKQGDSIIVYSGDEILRGTVASRHGDTIEFRERCGIMASCVFHVKQCRLLKRKKLRRRLWLPNKNKAIELAHGSLSNLGKVLAWLEVPADGDTSSEYTEFIEVRKKK